MNHYLFCQHRPASPGRVDHRAGSPQTCLPRSDDCRSSPGRRFLRHYRRGRDDHHQQLQHGSGLLRLARPRDKLLPTAQDSAPIPDRGTMAKGAAMTLKNSPQRIAHRMTKTLGLLLLPLAFCGFALACQKVLGPRSSAPLVGQFTRAIQTADWHTASVCYPQQASQLRQKIEDKYGPVRTYTLRQSEDYHLPFRGEHVIYVYDLHCQRHDARMTVETGVRKGAHPT